MKRSERILTALLLAALCLGGAWSLRALTLPGTAQVPRTGDNTVLWIVVMVVSGLALLWLLIPRKKGKHQK